MARQICGVDGCTHTALPGGLALHRRRKHPEWYALMRPTPGAIVHTGPCCPACGVLEAEHWRCAACTAKGHILKRSTQYPDYCQWCVTDGGMQRHQRELAAGKKAA